jgi:hypothetical protein
MVGIVSILFGSVDVLDTSNGCDKRLHRIGNATELFQVAADFPATIKVGVLNRLDDSGRQKMIRHASHAFDSSNRIIGIAERIRVGFCSRLTHWHRSKKTPPRPGVRDAAALGGVCAKKDRD